VREEALIELGSARRCRDHLIATRASYARRERSGAGRADAVVRSIDGESVR
jgi:hypothetical protein